MKNKHWININLLLVLLVSAGFFLAITSSTSMDRNAFWGGYSLPRLVMILIIFMNILFCFLLLVTINLKLRGLYPKLEKLRECLDKTNLLIPLFVLGLFLFLIEGAVLLYYVIGSIQYSSGFISTIIERALLFIEWFSILTLLGLINVIILYRSKIFKFSNWSEAARNARFFIKKVPVIFWLFLIVMGLAFGIMLAYSPAFAGRIPRHDSGIFLYFGSRILKGDIPFRDLWDHKPPLIFYIDALGLLLFNNSVWGVWFLELVSLFLSIFCLFRLLRPHVKPSSVFMALVGLTVTMVMVMEGGNLTEEFGLPIQCITLLLYGKYVLNGKNKIPVLFLIGMALGTALMLKQTLVGIWVSLFIFSFVEAIKHRSFSLKDFFAFLAGMLLILLGWIGYFLFNQSLWDLWDVAYRYNFIYSDITFLDRLDTIRIIFWVFFNRSSFLGLGFLVWILYCVLNWGFSKKIPALLQIALINLPIEILLISTSGENYDHYFFTILPCMTILTAYGWDFIRQSWINRNLLLKSLSYVLIILILIVYPLKQVVEAYRQPEDQTMAKTIEYIQSSTGESDTILLWGSQTTINFMTKRDSPTRFVHQKPLFRSGYANLQLSQEMLQDLKTKKPRLIIDTNLPSTPFIKMVNHQCYFPEGPQPEGMEEVFQYICDTYDWAGDIADKDHWHVYRLKEE